MEVTKKALYYVSLKGKKGYLKDRERDRRWRGFNYVVNPKKSEGRLFTYRQIINIKREAKEFGVSLKIIKKVDEIIVNSTNPPRDLKQRALYVRGNFLNHVKNRMRELVSLEKKLIKAKEELLLYSKRLDTVNKTLKPLMKHGESGYSEPKPEKSN